MIFLRLLGGYLLQVVPFALAAVYALSGSLRCSLRSTIFRLGVGILALGMLFAAAGTWAAFQLPGDYSLFTVVNIFFFISLIFCIPLLFQVSNVCWQEKLFVFLLDLCAALSMTSVCNFLSTWLNTSGYDGLPYDPFSLLVLLLVTALFLPLFLQMLKSCFKPVEKFLNPAEYGYLSLLAGTLFILLSSGFSFLPYSSIIRDPAALFLFIVLQILTWVLYIVVFRMLHFSAKSHQSQVELDQAGHLLDLEKVYYQQMKENIESARRLRHDMKHNSLTLIQMMQNGREQDALAYLQEYVEQIEHLEMVFYSGNAVLDALFSYYNTAARDRGIGFSVKASLLGNLPVSDLDLTVLLRNLLDNALEAASDCTDKKPRIDVRMRQQEQMLTIAVDNTMEGKIIQSSQSLQSTKAGHSGLGLKSVLAIAQKYDGTCQYEAENGLFHVNLLLNLPAESAKAAD